MRKYLAILLVPLAMGCYRSDQDIVLDYNAFDPGYTGEPVIELLESYSFTAVVWTEETQTWLEIPSATFSFRVKEDLFQIPSSPYQIKMDFQPEPGMGYQLQFPTFITRNHVDEGVFTGDIWWIDPGEDICLDFTLGNQNTWAETNRGCITVQ